MRVGVDMAVSEHYGHSMFEAPAVFELANDGELQYTAEPPDAERERGRARARSWPGYAYWPPSAKRCHCAACLTAVVGCPWCAAGSSGPRLPPPPVTTVAPSPWSAVGGAAGPPAQPVWRHGCHQPAAPGWGQRAHGNKAAREGGRCPRRGPTGGVVLWGRPSGWMRSSRPWGPRQERPSCGGAACSSMTGWDATPRAAQSWTPAGPRSRSWSRGMWRAGPAAYW
jgi:hypothetical protein